ncbi:MAG: hypothetical protein VW405_00670 [Rhodospirillaceae bacterium]
MTIAYDAKSNYTGSATTNFSWTHTPVGTPAGIVVTVVQDSSTTDEVTGVTYGGEAMTNEGDAASSIFGARVYLFTLLSSIPTGAQTVAVTVSGGSAKIGGCVSVTAGYSSTLASSVFTYDASYTTTDEPSIDVTVPAHRSGFICGGVHTTEGVGASLAAASGYTEVYEVDFGTRTASIAYKNTPVTGASALSWADTGAGTDSAVGGAIALYEPLFTVALDQATETDESRALAVYKAVTLDRATETDAARNLSHVYIERATETDSSRTIAPLLAAWPTFSGTRTFVSLNEPTVDTAVSGAASGDVFVLTNEPYPGASGITGYTWTSSLPAGATLRGNPTGRGVTGGASALPYVVVSSVTIGDNCTLRDMHLASVAGAAFSFSGTAWFENCTFGVTVAGAPPSNADDYVVFSRCTFLVAGDAPLFDDDDAAAGSYYFYDCLFLDKRTSGTEDLIHTYDGDITFVNCTFGPAYTNWLAANPGGGGTVTFTNCVFSEAMGDLLAPGNVQGTYNWSTASGALPVGETIVTNLHLNDGNYADLSPTNQSKFRAGGTVVDRAHAGPMLLDRNYLPYHATTPSAGCYQWQAESGCLYKQRSTDPLDGFSFTYGVNTLDTTYATGFETKPMQSHLDVSAIVRSYVWDLVHPSRGYFYVTWDGYYRLLLHAGQFDLTVTSPASRIFGAQTLTAEEDTG